MVLSEIDILNPEVAGLHQPPPGVVQPTGPESFIAIKPGQKRGPGAHRDDGETLWPPRPGGVDATLQEVIVDGLVEQDPGTQRLVLRRGRVILLDRQVSQERFPFAFANTRKCRLPGRG